MADDKSKLDPKPQPVKAEDAPGAPVFPVAVDKNAVVGESPDVRKIEAEVNDEAVDPQKVGLPAEPVKEVPVYEVFVTTDEQVDYVFVPPEGRGDATLPIHHYIGAKTVEEVFAEEGKK